MPRVNKSSKKVQRQFRLVSIANARKHMKLYQKIIAAHKFFGITEEANKKLTSRQKFLLKVTKK